MFTDFVSLAPVYQLLVFQDRAYEQNLAASGTLANREAKHTLRIPIYFDISFLSKRALNEMKVFFILSTR